MTGEKTLRVVEIVGATALVTSVFWLLMGALVWPYATSSGRIGISSPFRTQQSESDRQADRERAASPVPGGPRDLIVPVAGAGRQSLIDTSTQSREDGARHHDAIDIMAREGTPVVAAAAGTVEKLYRSENGGNTIYIRSPDSRLMFYYAHLQGYAPGLAEGQSVRPGDALGAVGWTGNVTADNPHLHFAIWEIAPEARWWETGVPINPYPLLQAGSF